MRTAEIGQSLLLICSQRDKLVLMSTLKLEQLTGSIVKLKMLIRAGKTVRLTEKGKTVATIAPEGKKPSTVRTKKRRMAFREFDAKYLKALPEKGDLSGGAFLRSERDKE